MSDLKSSVAPFRQPTGDPRQHYPYTGPATPTAYDPNWRKYTNLTPAQIDAFKAMPETCQQVARDLRTNHVRSAMPEVTPDMTLAQVQAACDAAKAAAATHYATEATITANIGKSVHTQADVEAAFKVQKAAA